MKYFLIIISSLIILFSCSNDSGMAASFDSEAENPNIYIEITNMDPGQVSLVGIFEGQNFLADTSSLDASGKVRFQKDTPYKPGLYFVLFANNQAIQLLVDKDQTMEISADAQDIVLSTIVKGNLETELLFENFRYEDKYREKLSPVNEKLKNVSTASPEYSSLKAQQESLIAQRKSDLEKIFTKYPNSFFTSFKRAGQNPITRDVRNEDGSVNSTYQVYLYRTEFWDNVDFSDTRLLYTPVISNKIKRYVEQLTTQNPDSINYASSFLIDKVLDYPDYLKYFANYIALKYEPTKSSIMDSEKIYVHMIQNYFTKERAFWSDSMVAYGLQQRASEMAASLTGLKGPNVTAKDINGNMQSIYDMTSDYIVVYLYNPTCEHCMEQTPKLVEMYENLKKKSIDVYAIGIDTNDQEWRDYVRKTKMKWTSVYDPTNRAIYKKYYVDITPEVYILNKDRTIIAKNIQVEQIEEAIRLDRAK